MNAAAAWLIDNAVPLVLLFLAVGQALTNRRVNKLRADLDAHRHPDTKKAPRRAPGQGATEGPETTTRQGDRPAQRSGRSHHRKDQP